MLVHDGAHHRDVQLTFSCSYLPDNKKRTEICVMKFLFQMYTCTEYYDTVSNLTKCMFKYTFVCFYLENAESL